MSPIPLSEALWDRPAWVLRLVDLTLLRIIHRWKDSLCWFNQQLSRSQACYMLLPFDINSQVCHFDFRATSAVCLPKMSPWELRYRDMLISDAVGSNQGGDEAFCSSMTRLEVAVSDVVLRKTAPRQKRCFIDCSALLLCKQARGASW